MIAAAREIATAAVSAMLRQLSFGIWRHRKIICEGMDEDRGRREEAAGEGGKGHEWGGQGGKGVDGGARQAAKRGDAGSEGAAVNLRGRQERVETAERGGRHGEGGGPEGRPPLMPFRQSAIPPEQESEMQERAWMRIRGEAPRLAEKDREVRRGSAGCRKRRRRWPEGRTASSRTQKVTPPPRMWRGGHRPGKGPERREERLDRSGGSGAGSRSGEQGLQGGPATSHPRPRASADGLRLGVATAAAVCAAAGTEGA